MVCVDILSPTAAGSRMDLPCYVGDLRHDSTGTAAWKRDSYPPTFTAEESGK